MKFDLKRPCAGCPFSTGPKAVRFLGYDRAEEIVDSLLSGATFSCHETNDFGDGEAIETRHSQHCAGALILLEREERPNQLMRIAERIGLYDRTKLDDDAPVVDDFDSFIDVQGDC